MTKAVPIFDDLPIVAKFTPLTTRQLDLPVGIPCFISHNAETGQYVATIGTVDHKFDRLLHVNLFIRDLLDNSDQSAHIDHEPVWWNR